MASSTIVTGFNAVANILNTAAGYVPAQVSGVTGFLAHSLGADGLKTFVVKPLVLAGQTLKFVQRDSKFPVLCKLAHDATPMKALISASEVITKLPKMLQELSTRVENSEFSRNYTRVDGSERQGVEWSPIEMVSNRIFSVASWAIAVGDAISFARHSLGSLPQKLDKATPWIYTVAGGYMGVQTLYTEWRHAQGTWKDANNNATPAEKRFGYLSLAASMAYIFSSAVGGLGLYFKGRAPAWLGKIQFAANVGVTVMPFAQKCAKAYMDKAVWK
ncbi:MAG: hypothetical protein KBA81_03935 [Rhabdochlamydiaceae bacterium]|nr:hypothetical protein [Rhabdochlamydiaceae bacterium]